MKNKYNNILLSVQKVKLNYIFILHYNIIKKKINKNLFYPIF